MSIKGFVVIICFMVMLAGCASTENASNRTTDGIRRYDSDENASDGTETYLRNSKIYVVETSYLDNLSCYYYDKMQAENVVDVTPKIAATELMWSIIGDEVWDDIRPISDGDKKIDIDSFIPIDSVEVKGGENIDFSTASGTYILDVSMHYETDKTVDKQIEVEIIDEKTAWEKVQDGEIIYYNADSWCPAESEETLLNLSNWTRTNDTEKSLGFYNIYVLADTNPAAMKEIYNGQTDQYDAVTDATSADFIKAVLENAAPTVKEVVIENADNIPYHNANTATSVNISFYASDTKSNISGSICVQILDGKEEYAMQEINAGNGVYAIVDGRCYLCDNEQALEYAMQQLE